MSKKNISVFTPTYNRGFIIQKCYESLCRQSNKNFIWLIVDDGSSDNTEEIVNSFINENKIEIIYQKQENGGKHVAHNTGVLKCETEIFVCVDSDDYLSDDAIQTIYDNWDEVKNEDSLAGIIALRGKSITEPIGTWMPQNIKRASIIDLYEKNKFKGDTILVFKTKILKKYLFPVFEGENFVTEAVIYDQISQKHDMKLLNKVLYFCEYLEGGYTRNISQIHRRNPKGYIHYFSQRIDMANGLTNKYRAVSYYVAGCLRIRSLFYYKMCNNKFLKVISIPKGVWIYIKPLIKDQLIKLGLLKI
ncbi:glycosyltransferase family 2 protein [Peribacillus frigoritolerans]|uniref:glycosyltransferase family 2 protein n=1 Tax=Peribacillus frigoritolerans TaxID=450367 RepID=UPI0024C15606|nr:glycosyltransferase family 2 protein [Peribacillus frigoritolerans]WHX60509.1 glycosyltransferase family 2 protein [Peribacillus frigoritolerans]